MPAWMSGLSSLSLPTGLGAQRGCAAARTMPSSLNVLGDEEQRLGGLDRGLENGDQRLKRRELLLVDEDVGGLEPRPLAHTVTRLVQITKSHYLSAVCRGGNVPPNYRRFTARLSRAQRWREADPAGGKLRCVSQSHFR